MDPCLVPHDSCFVLRASCFISHAKPCLIRARTPPPMPRAPTDQGARGDDPFCGRLYGFFSSAVVVRIVVEYSVSAAARAFRVFTSSARSRSADFAASARSDAIERTPPAVRSLARISRISPSCATNTRLRVLASTPSALARSSRLDQACRQLCCSGRIPF